MSVKNEKGFKYLLTEGSETGFWSVKCVDESKNEINTIFDISDDYETVRNFCEMLNTEMISPCHFEEVFDDCFG